ncbi:LacI family DNA-binding transcriptional regulator [Cedecea sp. S5-13]|uniref:LacI family DNA-binding transcriptional regulator n=1 Tax=Cedecea selenatireducens TaxID=3144416 RepID=UPI0035CD0C54
MKKPLTIKDIAELAQVSIATVSRVLNNNSWVADKTRSRVEKVIQEHNFSPNLLARGMISKKTQTLAIVVSDISNPYFVMLVAQIEHESLRLGYKVTLYDTQSANRTSREAPVVPEEHIFNSITDSQIDGVIILGGNIDYNDISATYLQELKKLIATVPVVVVGRKLPGVEYACVERDQTGCVRLATRHLIDKGYRRIGFIGGSKNVYITREREAVFRTELESAGLPVENSFVVLNNFYLQHGYEAIESLIANNEALPDAIVAINDHVAKGAIRALKDKNLLVPENIAVVSCEYFPGSEYFIPRITTVDHQNALIGKEVMRRLMAILNQNADVAAAEKIPISLTGGESS